MRRTAPVECSFLQPDERTKRLKEAKIITDRIVMQLVEDRKATILAESGECAQTLEKKSVRGRDILTLLIRSNMATDIPDHQRLSDDEVLARGSHIRVPERSLTIYTPL